MRTFEYRGFDAEGRSSRGLVEALDIKDVRERLAERGVYPEDLRAAGGTPGRGRTLRRGAMGIEMRALLYREMAALVQAGLPLAAAMQVLIDSPELGEARRHLAGVRDRVRDGSALAQALSDCAPGVAAFETAVIEAGEKAGTLDVVLERLAGFMEEQERVRDRIVTALVYPTIVVAATIVIGVLTLGILVPRIGGMLEAAAIPLPALTRAVMTTARALPWAGGALLAAVLGLAAVAHRRNDLKQWIRLKAAMLVRRVPVIAAARAALIRLRFARTLAMLVRGGVGMVEAVTLAGRATGHEEIVVASLRASAAVKHGSSLADAIRSAPVLGESLPGWIQAGEASGRLPDLLDNAANRYQQQWERGVTRALSVTEPVLILLVSALVLVIALAILMPIMSLNQALQ
ncbi:MAG: Type II secretion system protein F [Verrucomicrobia bacterium ADurb.Bin345]|nr:MAG: Type II secretion system protein F [Verrucomicrobia bacterium ADurb.Bin345]